MASETVYTEIQKFDQRKIRWLLYIVLFGTAWIPVYAFIIGSYQLLTVLIFLVVCIVFLLFRKMYLLTEIDEEKIAYQFYPFQVKKKIILKRDIQHIGVVAYDPISEYGGWGVRYGRSGKAYTVKGVYGIRIHFSNSKNLLIGTSQPEQAALFLKSNSYNPLIEISIA